MQFLVQDSMKDGKTHSSGIVIRREYKPEDIFIIFRPEVATTLQLNRKFQPLLYNRFRFHLLLHSIRSSNTLS